MNTRSGFTLVEALVTGVLSTIVAGTLVSVLAMVNTQIKEGVAESRLGRLQLTASDEIRASARKSWGFLQPDDPTGVDLEYDKLGPVANVQEVLMCDKDGNPMSKYRIRAEDGVLLEWHAGDPDGYHEFTLGGDVIHVDPALSNFSFGDGRKDLKFKLVYTLEGKTLPEIEEAVLCRNLSN